VPKSSKNKHETRRANRDRRQRLEELRKQQRAAERRKNWLFAGSAIVVAIILISAAVIPAYLHDRNEKKKQKEGYQAAPTSAEKTAGCLGVHNDPLSAAAEHFQTPIDYTKEQYGDTRGGTQPIPPTGGKHNALSLGDTQRFYDIADKPRPERAVHNLEHGYIVVWYDSKLPAADVTKLKALATNPAYPRLLVVGWWQSVLPSDKHVVFTSWGRTDRCASVNDDMAKQFFENHVNASFAPESGSGPISGADSVPAGQLPPTASPTPSPGASTSASPSPSSSGKK
jgi:hypothetical protein